MHDKEQYPTYREVWGRVRESHQLFVSIDPYLTWLGWIMNTVGSLRGILGFAAFGVLLQQMVQDIAADGAPSMITMLAATIAVGVFGIITIAWRAYGEFREELYREKYARMLDEKRMSTLVRLDLGRLWDPEFVAIRSRFDWRGMKVHESMLSEAGSALGTISATTTACGILLALDPILILFALIPLGPTMLERIWRDRTEQAHFEKHRLMRDVRRMYTDHLTEESKVIQSKLMRSLDYFWDQYRKYLDLEFRASRELSLAVLKSRSLVQATTVLTITLAVGYISVRIARGAFSITEVMLIVGSMHAAARSLADVGYTLVQLKVRAYHFRWYEEYINAKPLIDESDAGSITLRSPPKIAFDNVTFAYPRQQNENALNGCSFTIEPGERVAIIGRNGSGKTTAVRMIAKVFQPHGEIRINDVPLREITQESLLEHLMYVTQDSNLPDVTIREAIAACDPAHINHERLQRAVAMVGLESVFETLPHGLETMLNPARPEGVDLSGGQKQRLKLVAAFYRLFDPQIYIGIFDEPMSNCDAETRERFYASLRGLSNKTLIVVLHDPLYLSLFERIIVMHQGRVVQDLRGKATIDAYRSVITEKIVDDLFGA